MRLFKKKRGSRKAARDAANANLIRTSLLFDDNWYLKQYPDILAARFDPALHYICHGSNERRNPGPYFDTDFYLSSNPDVAASGMNALVHYMLHGEKEGRSRVRGLTTTVTPAGDQETSHLLALPGLFDGSTFHDLAISDPVAIARFITRSATSAEILPRVDSESYSPVISIILPIYNTPPKLFREALQSIFAQTYINWELCMVDDGSSSPQAIAIFDEMAQSTDSRIKTLRLEQNRGIAGASHAALSLATGDFVGFVDHDDMLTYNALSEVIGCLRADPKIDFIYTDHVMVDQNGDPKHFSRKPAWSPEFLLSTNYIVHFKVVRHSLLLSIGGLEREVDNVQDLGITCALVAAGAKVKYLPKPVYFWREHRASVALSTAAKPGIEALLMQVYDRYLEQLSIRAKQTWPTAFRTTRTGVFQLEFTGDLPSVALILLSRGGDEDENNVLARFAPVLSESVTPHIVSLSSTGSNTVGTVIETDSAMLEFIRSLDAEIVAFAGTTGQYLGIDWLRRLAGYVAMAPTIGAAGGKVLDPWLQIRSGGLLLDAAGEYRTIAGGCFDNENAHWFIGQVASNVDAISSQLMATRRNTLIEMGGINFHTLGDAAGVAYCAALVSKGYRIVYDPHSRHCDTGRQIAPSSTMKHIREIGSKVASMRVYPGLGA
jgi:GT2 family glycosyltransferase